MALLARYSASFQKDLMVRGLVKPVYFALLLSLLALPVAAHWTASNPPQKMPEPDDGAVIIPPPITLVAPDAIPKSRWLTAMRDGLITALPKADTLVLPPQVQGYGLSRALRGTFGELLVQYLADNGASLPASSFDLQRVFGPSRAIHADEISHLSQVTKVGRIIEPHVGWLTGPDKSRLLVLTLREGTRSDDGQWHYRTSKPSYAKLEALRSPLDVFEDALKQQAGWLGLKLVQKAPTQLSKKTDLLPFHWSDEATTNASQIQKVGHLQMMGALTPYSSDARDVFFGRSLLLLRSIDNSDGSLDGWYARAYSELGLEALSRATANQRKETCYQFQLYRHLKALKDCAETASPLEQPLLLLEALKMADDRNLDLATYVEAIDSSLASASDWLVYVNALIQSWDHWAPIEHEWLKAEMDEYFGVDGYSMDQVRALSITDPAAYSLELLIAPAKHHSLILERHPERLLSKNGFRPSSDRLNLMQAYAFHGIYRMSYRAIRLQARPSYALKLIERAEGHFAGHPLLAHIRALYHDQQSESVTDNSVGYHREQKYEHASRATFWTQGNSFESLVSRELRNPYPPEIRFSRPGTMDFPQVLTYLTTKERVENPFVHAPASFSAFRSSAHTLLARGRGLGELAKYFIDHPERVQITIDDLLRQHKTEKAIPLIEDAIAKNPERFKNYDSLGEIYLRQGQPEKAARLYREYPPFKAVRDHDRLRYGNEAYGVAIRFGSSGRRDLAEHFHKVVLEYPSGSGSYYMSALWLAIRDGDFNTAFSYAYQNARRYPGADSFASYLGLMSTFGDPEQALAAFDNYVGSQQSMIAWIPAHTAQRILGWEDREILDWLNRKHLSELHRPSLARLNHYVRATTMDRGPTTLDLSFLRREIPLMVACGGHYAGLDQFLKIPGAAVEKLEPGAKATCKSPVNGEAVEGKIQRHELEAYLVMRNFAEDGDFDSAYKVLVENFELPYQPSSHNLPLIAWVLMENNDVETLDSIIEYDQRSQTTMQMELARAIRSGYSENKAEALANLNRALGHHLGTGNRWAVSPYLIGHTMYLLWIKTGDSAYRERAAEFARSQSFGYLGYGWPFALLALVSEDRAEQADAASKALYLDRRSKWFSLLPRDIQDEANDRLADGNPFMEMLERTEVAASAKL